MKKYLLLSAILIISTSFRPSSISTFDLYFDKNDEFLSQKATQHLAEISQKALASKLGYQISLEIFPTNNDALDRGRVDEILGYLEAEQIKVDKILYYSNPEHVPADVKLKKDWNFIRLTLDFPLPPTISAIDDKEEITNNNEDPQKEMPQWAKKVVDYKKNEEIFEISNFSEVKLELDDGSFVEFEAESFVFEDGTLVTTPVEITTKHATTKNIAILEELTTISDGQLLESRGMMYVNATSMGKQLRLAEGKKMSLGINSKQASDGFQAYQGQRKMANGKMDWFLEEEPAVSLEKEKAGYRFYNLEELSEKEREIMDAKRQTIIDDWKRKGHSRSIIRRRLKNAKTYTKNKDSRLRRRIRRKTSAVQPYLRRNQILGKTKYKYVEFENLFKATKSNIYKMRSTSLGWKNIDQLLHIMEQKPPCNLFVKADEKTNVKIIFRDYFGVFKGAIAKGQFVFPNFPATLRVSILAAEKLPNGDVRYAYDETVLDNKTVVLNNYKTVSKTEFISFVEGLNI